MFGAFFIVYGRPEEACRRSGAPAVQRVGKIDLPYRIVHGRPEEDCQHKLTCAWRASRERWLFPTGFQKGVFMNSESKTTEQVKLVKADLKDAAKLHEMQVTSFWELFEKYQDFDTSPSNEPVEKVEARLKQDFTFFYFICIGTQRAGAIRIVDTKESGKNKRISPIFILPEFQGRGIAQKAIQLCEKLHGSSGWELDTILQEPKNCHLYEKLGYRRTGKTEAVNDKLTLVFYEK